MHNTRRRHSILLDLKVDLYKDFQEKVHCLYHVAKEES
jgi:hypothetical protein